MLIVGHRGARGEAPENTLSGFRHLRSLGLRAVEFDIRLSADDIPVVIHDASVDRTARVNGLVSQLTAARLAALDAAHHRTYPNHASEDEPWPEPDGIPTLADALALMHDFTHLQLEVKAEALAQCAALIDLLPPLLEPFGGRAIVTSFHQGFLQALGEHHPRIPRGLLLETDGDIDNLVSRACDLGCLLVGPHFTLWTPERVAAAHAAGLHATAWTVNAPADMLRLREWGVDSLITDLPALALKTLGPR